MTTQSTKPNTALAWLAGAVFAVVAGVGAYMYGDRAANKPEPPATVQTAPSATGQAAAPSTGDQTAARPEATEPSPTETAGATDEPHFDVLRVEPDGSAVVAGTAPASTKIELLSGDTVIATANAGPDGAFAIVLDQPLAKGDHALTLRSTAPDGKSVVSSETGIVKVPEAGGELMAMVSKEGAATRITQAPEAAAPQAGTATASDATPAQEKPAEQTASAEPAPEARTDAGTGTQPEQQAATPAQPETAGPPVLVKAVDVDGNRIFVAGSGVPGRRVNVYIDDRYIGTTEIGEEGGFLLEATGGLESGRHEIRADMVAEDGATVVSRAAVPLLHEMPETVASASQATEATPSAPAEAKPAETNEAAAEAAGPAEKAESAAGQPSSEAKTEAAAPAEQPVQAAAEATRDAATEAAGKVAAAAVEPATETAAPSAAEQPAAAAQATGQPAQSGSETAAAHVQAPATGPAQAAPAQQQAEMPKAETAPAAGDATEKPAEIGERMAAAPAAPAAQESAASAAPQAPAESGAIVTGASVIIRRGDNLWRISRRMLGEGIKYTVIYEANRDQIRNPHWIYPGQVFDVPGASEETQGN